MQRARRTNLRECFKSEVLAIWLERFNPKASN
jgi:hypothetical protein